jgi:hypothetical protein
MALLLDVLSPEVIQAVVGRVPRPHLQQARLACRAFDAASRALDATDTITLTPENVQTAPTPTLDWSRFPKLKTLRLRAWTGDRRPNSLLSPDHACLLTDRLQMFFIGQRLAAVTTLCIDRGNTGLDPGTVALVAASLQPNLRSAVLSGWGIRSADVLCALADSAPQLESVVAPDHMFDPMTVQCIGRLQQLTNLSAGFETGRRPDFAALRPGQLTRLSVNRVPNWTPERAALFHDFGSLVELAGPVEIDVDELQLLTQGAPNLSVLRITLFGDWADLGAGCIFPKLTHFSVNTEDATCRGLNFAIFPALRHLATSADSDGRYPSLTGFKKGLRSLALTDDPLGVQEWAAIASLTSLTAFGFCYTTAPFDPKHLTALTQLEWLEVVIGSDGLIEPEVDIDIDAALTTVSSLCISRKLHTVSLYFLHTTTTTTGNGTPCCTVDTRTLNALMHATPRLRILRTGGTLKLSLDQVELLSMHPGLRRLMVACDDSDLPQVQKLLGPEIEVEPVVNGYWFHEFQAVWGSSYD